MANAIDPVCCRQCRGFIPDPVGDGYGLGKCKAIENYKLRNPSKDKLRKAIRTVGNDPDVDLTGSLFWGGTEVDRRCEKYQEKIL